MRAFEISELKPFTDHLFLGELFDRFEVIEASFTTLSTFTLDGTLHPDFFDTDEQEALKSSGRTHAYWKELKPIALSIIRGKRSPLQFRIVLSCSDAARAQMDDSGLLPKDSASYFLNLQYRSKQLQCVTGASLKTFLPGVHPDHAWDDAVAKFLRQHEIAYSEV